MLAIPAKLETVITEHANAQGITPIALLEQIFSPQSQEPDFDFDLERMENAIKGYETKELALKNGLMLPTGKTPEQLLAWLDTNIPAHLAKKAVVCE